MTTLEDEAEARARKLNETAVNIAAQVNTYVHRECQRKINYGISSPFLLEDMTFAYACALAKFSLYKAMAPEFRPEWEELENAAFEALKIAFSHVKAEIDKELDTCQFSQH